MCGWVMGWVWIWPVAVLVGLVLLGYAATRFVQGREPSLRPGASSARHILDERYARGEIDEEEYQRRRDLLR
jgi:putative membrane protein